MNLNTCLYLLAKDLRRRYRSMDDVAAVLGTRAKTVRNWKNSSRITITPEMIEGLHSCGYDIAVVPLDCEKKTD